MTLPDDFINPEHQGADQELLRVFYEACYAEAGRADEITLRGLRAVLAYAAADKPAAVAPQQGLPWSADPPAAGQRQPLSPVAQAVLDAVLSLYSSSAAREMARPLELASLVAAIRALADQVVPEGKVYTATIAGQGVFVSTEPFSRVRAQLVAIAAELEGANG